MRHATVRVRHACWLLAAWLLLLLLHGLAAGLSDGPEAVCQSHTNRRF
jgi:hypothetical protein